MNEEYEFELRRLVVQRLVDKALLMDANRFKRLAVDDLENYDAKMIRWLVDILVQEEDLCCYPADWWQALKERWFPEWLKRKAPVEWTEVIAVHKFPELNPPDSVLGREFVNLKIVEREELEKRDEE